MYSWFNDILCVPRKTYKVKTYHRNIIGTDKHGLLVKEKSGDIRYKQIKEIF